MLDPSNHRNAKLNAYVTSKTPWKYWVVRHNPLIGNFFFYVRPLIRTFLYSVLSTTQHITSLVCDIECYLWACSSTHSIFWNFFEHDAPASAISLFTIHKADGLSLPQWLWIQCLRTMPQSSWSFSGGILVLINVSIYSRLFHLSLDPLFRKIMHWACDKPLFWNAITWTCATTLPNIPSASIQRIISRSFIWNTRAQRSRRSQTFSFSSRSLATSVHAGLHAIVMKRYGWLAVFDMAIMSYICFRMYLSPPMLVDGSTNNLSSLTKLYSISSFPASARAF